MGSWLTFALINLHLMSVEFPWLSHYPKEVAHRIGAYQYGSLPDLFEDASKRFASRTAFENMGVGMTYGEVDRLSGAFAAYLQKKLGLRKGERIAIQMPNLLQFPIAFIGALRAGLIVVNTNPLYTPREMEHQFCDAGVSAVVIVENFAASLEQIRERIPARHLIVTSMGDMLGLKGWLVNFVVRHVKKIIPRYNLPGSISFSDVLREGARLQLDKPGLDIEDIAVLQYTGGTTGVSKGAQLSHRNLIAHNQIIHQWFQPYLMKKREEVMITALPMYHIFALTVNGILMYSNGVKNILITNPRDIPGFVKELKKHKFTILTGVNTLFNGLLNNQAFREQVDFSHLHGAIGGGMAVQDAVAIRWQEVTGHPLVEGYGLSETSPVVCCNPLDGSHRRGTIGLPVPSTEVAVFDDDGNRLPEGSTGEICVRGPQVMRGYWEKDNTGVFFGEWFRTGDIGIMDADGFFRIVDRKKDMIKVSGFNVYPNEIENVLAGHPKVLEVAAIGLPDEKSGECIKVFIVKRDASLTEQEIRDFCHANLTNYKVPRHVVFKNELPKSNVGKILRRELREAELQDK